MPVCMAISALRCDVGEEAPMPRTRHKIQFLAHRNATSAKKVMESFLSRRVFVDTARSVILDNLWSCLDSFLQVEQHVTAVLHGSCDDMLTHSKRQNSKNSSVNAGGSGLVRVLLIGFEDLQVRPQVPSAEVTCQSTCSPSDIHTEKRSLMSRSLGYALP
jgi:hypothetical protein